jgi:hypothetical protein
MVSTPSRAVDLRPGDVLIASRISDIGGSAGALLYFDPKTGERFSVSGGTLGTGPSAAAFRGVAMAPEGSIYVTGSTGSGTELNMILRVDPSTGNRSLISQTYGPFSSSLDVGTGPPFDQIAGIQVLTDGQLLVAGDRSVWRVDTVTGNRTLLYTAEGDAPFILTAIEDRTGSILIAGGQIGMAQMVSLDPQTGEVAIVSDGAHGNGTNFGDFFGAAILDANGNLLVASLDWASTPTPSLWGVFSVNIPTGDRKLISGSGVGATPPFDIVAPFGIGLLPSGKFIVTDYYLDQVFDIDPATGDRTRLAYFPPSEFQTIDLGHLVVVVPEPTTSALGIAGFAALLVAAHRRNKCRPIPKSGPSRIWRS